MTDGILYTQESSTFWDAYLKGRPAVPDSFWARIFLYHAEHSGKFDSVCDLGSGVGIHSPKLAARFPHVILCDPGQGNIDLARETLLSPAAVIAGTTQFDFLVCTAEKSSLPDASLDMVFMANAIHFTDPDLALRNIARQLKPGGTFVAAQFGLAYFEDAGIQAVFRQILEHSWVKLAEALVSENNTSMNLASLREIQDSAYDSIKLPPEFYESGIQRVKLNMHGRYKPFRMSDFGSDTLSKLGSHDECVDVDDTDWKFDMDLQGVKDQWSSIPFRNYDEEYMTKCWRDLEAAAPNGRYKGAWPVSIVLATRNK
jgi:ubiquinone/menaquinone biosynthesis C-methylase UbiE